MAGVAPNTLRKVMATMSTVDELEAKLAAAKAELAERDTDSTALEGTIDGEGGIYLVIREREFECRRVSTTWQMMKFAKAQREANVTIPSGLPQDSPKRKELEDKRNKAGMQMLELLLETALVLLKPHERDEFQSYMDEISADGLKPNELEEAIGNVIAAAGGEEAGKAEQTTASPSSASSGTPNENVRVISFNKATQDQPETA